MVRPSKLVHRISGLVLAGIAATAILISTTPEAEVAPPAQAGGALVIVGGGPIPREILACAMELAGGPDARIVVLPQASRADKHSDSLVDAFRAVGARNIRSWRFENQGQANEKATSSASVAGVADAINQANLIWLSGGSQTALMAALDASGFSQLIRERHRRGIAVGGSSAGAAVMADWMMTGGSQSLKSVIAGSAPTSRGLGLWPGVIIDQHFLKRRRNNRLLTAVLDRPDHVGIGIDESTALVTLGDQVEVLGESSVMVFDARNARLKPSDEGLPIGAMGILTHVLVRGMSLAADIPRPTDASRPPTQVSNSSICALQRG
ncbi:cyanophycinase [Mesorhizobium sp. CA10]|uniref:cyanophycinase n=1 Tax=Mesorhizobium sp. CA10 TaxID=588495 RepID=UPI001CCFAE67|nr:cyanophycinase [Mesorhizobium sp. CA10]